MMSTDSWLICSRTLTSVQQADTTRHACDSRQNPASSETCKHTTSHVTRRPTTNICILCLFPHIHTFCQVEPSLHFPYFLHPSAPLLSTFCFPSLRVFPKKNYNYTKFLPPLFSHPAPFHLPQFSTVKYIKFLKHSRSIGLL